MHHGHFPPPPYGYGYGYGPYAWPAPYAYGGYAQAPYAYGAPQTAQGAAPRPVLNQRFVTGALVGAAAAYMLSNPAVQDAAIKGAVKVWTVVQGGVEEMKERFRDAEAELHAAQVYGDVDDGAE
ncbi:MAG: hypothetical protein RIB45_02185 [Marivibrio sp.]|uniref:hypothetical protein n=1 Tax=Marivibrio sp. TaxID=2039719 RepID=UPI0032EA9FF1